jgi:hypothetical protein
MSYIIQRTNPDQVAGRSGTWRCCVCEHKYDDENEARSCAERDHAANNARRNK